MAGSVQRLPPPLLFAFLVLLGMFVPLSMDLYLPALPEMSRQLGGAVEWVNLTLTGFFVFFAVGALVWGPLSDKHGRRTLLVTTLLLYVAASVACALSQGIVFLIASRCFQGLAAGGIATVSMAVIKDSFEGARRVRFLAFAQTAGALAPMVAPTIGTWILSFSDWRVTFLVLAGIGALALALALAFSESHHQDQRFAGTFWGGLRRMGHVLRNPRVSLVVGVFAVAGLPFLGYISASSYIYVDQFHLTRQQFALFFAGNAAVLMVSPLLYARWGSRVARRVFPVVGLGVCLTAGLGLVLFGSSSPWAFFALFASFTLANTTLIPFSTNLVFDQHDGDNGSLASILGTIRMVMGSLGMVLASLPTTNRIALLGSLITVCAALALVSWLFLLGSNLKLVGIEGNRGRSFPD